MKIDDPSDRIAMLEAQLAAEQSAHRVDVERLRAELAAEVIKGDDLSNRCDDLLDLLRDVHEESLQHDDGNPGLCELVKVTIEHDGDAPISRYAAEHYRAEDLAMKCEEAITDRDRALSALRAKECELSAAVERAERAEINEATVRGCLDLAHRDIAELTDDLNTSRWNLTQMSEAHDTERTAHADTRRKMDDANEEIESLRGKLELTDDLERLTSDRANAAEQRVAELTELLREARSWTIGWRGGCACDGCALSKRIDAALSPPATKPDATKRESLADVRRRLGFPELSREEREQHVQDNIDAATDGKDGQP